MKWDYKDGEQVRHASDPSKPQGTFLGYLAEGGMCAVLWISGERERLHAENLRPLND